jgi:hypothetical protein
MTSSASIFIARSPVYYNDFINYNSFELSDEIIIPSYYLRQLLDLYEDESVLYIRITNIGTGANYIATIGTPHNDDKTVIYVPQWILDIIGNGDNGEDGGEGGDDGLVVRIEKVDMYTIPIATKIAIRPLDSVAFDTDIIQCFEKAFRNLHSIREGVMVPVGVPEFGEDFRMYAYIEHVEPADVSRIVHGEVDVEFLRVESETQMSADAGESLSPAGATISPPDAPLSPAGAPEPSLTAEERQRQIRESWLKRFQSNAGHQ